MTYKPEKKVFFKLQILDMKIVVLCCTESKISKNICSLSDFVFEYEFIHEFVTLVPKIVIRCDRKVIVYKMKMVHTFSKVTNFITILYHYNL